MSRRALVVGGTGPTGPSVINGLLDRGFEVTIFHSGTHEVPFNQDVEHIHGDAHFPESIAEALGTRTFDVSISQYGRLKHLAEHLRNRTGHLVAIGAATASLAHQRSPVWGAIGRPALLPEDKRIPESDESANKFGFRVAMSMQALFEIQDAGGFDATYLGYPILYGPRQPGPREWSVVRRILDGRRSIIVPDGGIKVESRGYVLNVARAPLLAIDNPRVSAGKTYIVTDENAYTEGQRFAFIAKHMGAELEQIDMPFDLATPSYPLYQHTRESRIVQSVAIRRDLGYTDTVPVDEALRHTVEWLVSSTEAERLEFETQLGDRFDYAHEDELVSRWENSRRSVAEAVGESTGYAHIYRHPKKPGEDWLRPADAKPPQ